MFGFLKLSGAPPRAYQYYRSTKDKYEREIIEDLYKEYEKFVKKWDTEIISGDYEFRKNKIFSSAFADLTTYGNDKEYSEFHLSLFYQG